MNQRNYLGVGVLHIAEVQFPKTVLSDEVQMHKSCMQRRVHLYCYVCTVSTTCSWINWTEQTVEFQGFFLNFWIVLTINFKDTHWWGMWRGFFVLRKGWFLKIRKCTTQNDSSFLLLFNLILKKVKDDYVQIMMR